ncbi:MAG: GAF domain-containing protein [Cyanobacteriota bacterium]|nr:GAF domain-containing protein [Cyanobacteriota bacterium]
MQLYDPPQEFVAASPDLLSQMQAANDIVQDLVSLTTQQLQDPGWPRSDLSQAIAESLVQRIVSRLGMARAQVWFYHADEGSFHAVARAGLVSPAEAQLQVLRPDQTPLGQVVRQGDPLLSNNLTQEPWILSPDWTVKEGLQAFAAYPINLGHTPVGALSIFSYHPLHPTFFEVLKLICSYSASAIVNARQTAQLQRQATRDGLIRHISQHLRHSLDASTMRQTLVQQVGQALAADRCDLLWIHASDPVQLEILASYQPPLTDLEGDPYQQLFDLLDLPALQNHLQAHQSLVVNHLSQLGYSPSEATYASLLVVPLLLQQQYHEDVLGYLALAYRDPHPFGSGEVELVQAIATQAALALNNAQLYERTRQQGEREALMNRVTTMLHQSLQWDQIVSTTLHSLQETLDLSRCCFYRLNPGGESISVTHEARYPELHPATGPYPLAEFGDYCQRIGRGEVVQIPDVGLEVDLPAGGRQLLEQLQIRSGVFVPVYADQSYSLERMPGNEGIPTPIRDPQPPPPERAPMIGLVGAYKGRAYRWQAAEVDFLRSIAQQLAISLTRSQLFDHAQQQTERLSLLHSITAVIRSSLDPSTLFHAITQQIGEAFQADICALQLWHPEDACLRPVGIYAPHLSSTQLEAMLPGFPLIRDPASPHHHQWNQPLLAGRSPDLLPAHLIHKLRAASELLGQVREPIVLSQQTQADLAHLIKSPLPPLEPMAEGVLLVPLLEGEQLIGSLSLKRFPPLARDSGSRPWQPADLTLAKAVAEQAAMAISQARLLTQTQKQAEQASLLNRMTDRIRHSLDVDEILQATVEEVAQALQASRVQFVFVNPQEETTIFRHAYAQPGIDSWLNRQIPSRENALIPYLQQQTQPIEINSWSDLSEFDSQTQARLEAAGVQSLMVARLWLDANTYGVLSVHRCRSDYGTPMEAESALTVAPEWQSDDQNLLKLVAEQLAIAINQSRLYAKTQQQARRESLLNEITTQIRTSLDPKLVLQSIVQSLAATLSLDRCEITLYRSQPMVLDHWLPPVTGDPNGFSPLPPAPAEMIPRPLSNPPIIWANGMFIRGSAEAIQEQHPYTFAESIAADHFMAASLSEGGSSALPLGSLMPPDVYALLRQGHPFVIQDTQADLRDIPRLTVDVGVLRQFFGSLSIRSMALIPIVQEGELIGTIAMIAYPEAREFQADELSLAVAVAEQAGIALKQAQLYEQTRTLALRESLLREIAQQLTSTYDPTQIIQIALAGMAKALQVDKCDFVGLASSASPLEMGKLAASPPSNCEGLRILQEYRRYPEIPSILGQLLPEDLSWLILLDCYGRQDSLLIEDVTTFPLPSQTRKNLLQAQIRALLCVPVMTDSTTVAGILCAFVPTLQPLAEGDPFASESAHLGQDSDGLNSPDLPEISPDPYDPQSRPFCNADTDLVQALADITAVALQRAQFYERARQQAATAAAVRGLTEGREAESRRLAADLHDQTLADLGAISRQIQHLIAQPLTAEQVQQALLGMSDQLRETIAELRGVVEDLQPTAMRAFNLGSALRSLLERAAQRSQQSLLTRFDNRSDDWLNRLDPVTQSTLFRIVQEALNNIVKHAQAKRIDISLVPVLLDATPPSSETSWVNAGDLLSSSLVSDGLDELDNPQPYYSHLEVKIIDDGVGIPVDPVSQGRHGLLNMRYRAELIGATIEWRGRRQGSGTVVQLLIPLPQPSASPLI